MTIFRGGYEILKETLQSVSMSKRFKMSKSYNVLENIKLIYIEVY
jgi:hypothetical protein